MGPRRLRSCLMPNRHAAGADRGGVGAARIRVGGGQARQVKRDRAVQRWRRGGCRRRADVARQVYELWFKVILFELEAARDGIAADDVFFARHRLHRVYVIEKLLIEQIEVLETMSPQDFLAFRSKLAPASGFQSVQFREIE